MKHAIAASLVALAAAIPIGTVGAQVASPAPLMQRDYQGVPYITGGIGETERQAIVASAREYNLQLRFAERGGAYLADVAVNVTGPGGQSVLNVRANGPYVLANLPAGTYQVSAEAKGQEQTRSVTIPATGQRSMTFYW
jgi:hypothetical protein